MGAGDYRGDCHNRSASDAGKDVAAFQVGMGRNPVSSNSALARPNTLTLSTSFVSSCVTQLPVCTNVLTPNTPTSVHSVIVSSPTVVTSSTLGTPITPSTANSEGTQKNIPYWDRTPDPKEWQNLNPAERNIVYVRVGPKEFWLSKSKLKLIQMNLGNTAISNNITQFIASNYHLNGPDNPFVLHKCDGTTMDEIMRDMNSSRSNTSSDSGLIRSSSEPVRSSVHFNLVQSTFTKDSSLQSSSLHRSSPSLYQSTSALPTDTPITTPVIYKEQDSSNNGTHSSDQNISVSSSHDHEGESDYSEDRANSSSERDESSDNDSSEVTREEFENAVETILATGGMFISENGEFSGSVLYDDSLVELEPESNDEEEKPLASDSEVDEEFILTVKESSTAEGIASNGSDEGTITDELFADHSDFDSSDDNFESFSNAEDVEENSHDTVRVMSVKTLHVSSGVIHGKSYRGSFSEGKKCIECHAVTGNFYKYCQNCWKIRKECLPSPPKRKKRKPRHRHKHRIDRQRSVSSGNSDEDVVDAKLQIKPNEVIVSEVNGDNSNKLSIDENSGNVRLKSGHTVVTSEKSEGNSYKTGEDKDSADQSPSTDCLSMETQSVDSGIGSSQEMVVDEMTERRFLKPSRVTSKRRRPSDTVDVDMVLVKEEQFTYTAISDGLTVKRRISDEGLVRKSKKKAVETNPIEELLTDNSVGLSNDEKKVSTDLKIKLASDAIVDFLCSEKSSKFFDSDYGRSWLCSKEVQATYRDVLIKSARDKKDDNDVSLCSLCCLRPKDAAIIHGRVSHQATCYPCAKTLFERKQRCPVCRRKILSISKHIIA